MPRMGDLAAQDNYEAEFQAGIRATPWFSEFKQKYGEEPNLEDPNYDYRAAWKAGARPDVRDPGDNMLHWSSQFKGPNHPNRFVDGVDTLTGDLVPQGYSDLGVPIGVTRTEDPGRLPQGWVMGSAAMPRDIEPQGTMWPNPSAPQKLLPDVGAPLVPSGGEFSAGHPVVNRAADVASALANQYVVPQTPSDYASLLAGGPLGRMGKILVNAAGNMLDSTEAQPGQFKLPKKIKAYHSSPHDFEKFDIGKIGTGEGAQVYGHGLYFAESPAVSGQGGQYWNQFLRRFEGTPEGHAAANLKAAKFDREAALNESKWNLDQLRDYVKHGNFESPTMTSRGIGQEAYKKHYEELLAKREAEYALLASGKPVGPRTYEVNINADPAHMLDWDKPLNRQSPEVVEGLQRAMRPSQWKEFNAADAGTAMNQGFIGLDKQIASEKLRDVGLPGIRYLDQRSRAAGTGSRNYVIFDPSIIDIMKKYGIVGAPVGTMGALAAQDSYQGER